MNQERRGRDTWTQFNDVQETKNASQYATVTSSYQDHPPTPSAPAPPQAPPPPPFNRSPTLLLLPQPPTPPRGALRVKTRPLRLALFHLCCRNAGQNRLGFVETSNTISVSTAACTTYNETLVALTQIDRSHEVSSRRPAPDNTLITDTASLLDPWALSPEQKAYYLSQFLRLQPDPRAKLSGLQAKAFFELSKLPNTELSDIWLRATTLPDCAMGRSTFEKLDIDLRKLVGCKKVIQFRH
ncbi:hypothetical protein AHF37_10493 [Paragonimus kellicotti]|nr:hypothetical protein AHF37_10493 [Paragonimus kellicotti]